MSNNFGIFLLFSVLVTGLIVNPSVFAEETAVNATDTIDMTESNSTSIETTDMTESNSTSTGDETVTAEDELETELTTEDEMTETEDEVLETEVMPTVLSPLKQIKEGVVPENVVCKEGLELVFKLNGQPACIKTTSIQKLIAWGWTQ